MVGRKIVVESLVPVWYCCFITHCYTSSTDFVFVVQLYMSCGLLIEADQLVELVKEYIVHYKECATSREQCVLEKLE